MSIGCVGHTILSTSEIEKGVFEKGMQENGWEGVNVAKDSLESKYFWDKALGGSRDAVATKNKCARGNAERQRRVGS
jgi:hypothetical protein